MTSENRFKFEWSKYKIHSSQEKQFNKWISPYKDGFKEKTIIDCGCGSGRNSIWMYKQGAKKIVAFDNNPDTIKIASKNLASFKNTEIIYKDIYKMHWGNEFDLAVSLGVIHHLEYPEKAIQNIKKAIKPNGKFVMGIYSYEGNEWIVKYINPIRKITSRLPIRLTYFISYFFSIPLYVFIHIFAKGEYFEMIKSFPFQHIHLLVTDQLLPRIANYWKKEEVLELMKPFKNVTITKINNNWWTAIGEK